MSTVVLSNLTKVYGDSTAVDHVNLELPDGKLTCLLGPSGCGKTTTLRMLAGFIEPDDGDILIGGASQRGVPPNRRPTALVFQDYALFPHLTVRQNISFGLMRQPIPKAEVRSRTEDLLERMGLRGLGDRRPGELSGGQQQRVALARSLALRPSVILMDEPLSNLDAKIRVTMRSELKAVQAEFGSTILYVTHDQEEAMSLGDQVAVMEHGKLQQVGTPQGIYYNPANEFVADFIGLTNWLDGDCVEASDGRLKIKIGDQVLSVNDPRNGITAGDPVRVSIRPENIGIAGASTDASRSNNHGVAHIESQHFHGTYERVIVDWSGNRLVIDIFGGVPIQGTRDVPILIREDAIRIFPGRR